MTHLIAGSDASSAAPHGLPQPRRYDRINWVGLRTLYLKEVRRFWKVGAQTVAAPVVTTLLYMMVFVVALKGARPPLHALRAGDCRVDLYACRTRIRTSS